MSVKGGSLNEIPARLDGSRLCVLRALTIMDDPNIILTYVIIHAGHEPSFGRDRLIAIADMYLEKAEKQGYPGPASLK
jgi:hypothetical protein